MDRPRLMRVANRNSTSGMSNGVRAKIRRRARIQRLTQAATMIVVRIQVRMILLNSNNSEVQGRKIRGTRVTRATNDARMTFRVQDTLKV